MVDPEATLRTKIVEFVSRGDFGLASRHKVDGTYDRVWFKELVAPDEITFESDLFLLRRATAEALRTSPKHESVEQSMTPEPNRGFPPATDRESPGKTVTGPSTRPVRLVGSFPPELWNRLGTKVVPKLRSGSDPKIDLDVSVTVEVTGVATFVAELRQIVEERGLGARCESNSIYSAVRAPCRIAGCAPHHAGTTTSSIRRRMRAARFRM